jgi:hypothetical protein
VPNPPPADPDPGFDPLRDRLFVGAHVYTLDPSRPQAEALAVRGGRVLAVGDEAETRARLAPDAETIRLDGATLLPGFHDAHVHLGLHGLERAQVPLGDTTSFDDAVARLRARAAETPAGGWVQGSGFAVQRWGDGEPDRAALDAAVPHHPVLLRSQDHHGGIANAVALERAGVHAATPDPPGGAIRRRADGQPSGYLLETAVERVARAVPPPTADELREALADGARSLAALGVTTVHHMAYEPAAHLRAMALAARDEAFPVRVWACLPQEEIESARALGVATGMGGPRFEVGGAKFFVDGALGSLTAWMLEPYDGGDDVGIALTDAETLRERVAAAVDAGLTPVAHAIGDAAVRTLLDAYEATEPAWRAAGLRPRVEHAQHVHPHDVARLGRLGLVASMQPLHLTFDAPTVHRRLAGRQERAYPIRSLAEAGAVLAFGSDTPVAPPDVVASLRAAVGRTGLEGLRVAPSEALTPLQAVRAYTAGAAAAIGRADRSGVLRPGADADLVAWSDDPLEGRFDGLTPRLTVVAGRIVHRA